MNNNNTKPSVFNEIIEYAFSEWFNVPDKYININIICKHDFSDFEGKINKIHFDNRNHKPLMVYFTWFWEFWYIWDETGHLKKWKRPYILIDLNFKIYGYKKRIIKTMFHELYHGSERSEILKTWLKTHEFLESDYREEKNYIKRELKKVLKYPNKILFKVKSLFTPEEKNARKYAKSMLRKFLQHLKDNQLKLSNFSFDTYIDNIERR